MVATPRPGKETDFVCDLGASHVVDYTGDLTSQVRAIAADGLAAVVHLAGNRRVSSTCSRQAAESLPLLATGPTRIPPPLP